MLRLSKGMSEKCAITGLGYGGAKAVVLAAPDLNARPAFQDGIARLVNSFNGRFRTGVDVGLSAADVQHMCNTSRWMVGTGSIAPDRLTAKGVFETLQRAHETKKGTRNLDCVRVGIQGLGKVGSALAKMLLCRGAKVLGGDVCKRANYQTRQSGPV